MTDLGQEFAVTMTLGTTLGSTTLGTTTLGSIGTPVVGRRVMPTRGPQAGQDLADSFRRVAMWLQGRPGRGHAARWPVAHLVEPPSPQIPADDQAEHRHPRFAQSRESVWGKVCGCTCG